MMSITATLQIHTQIHNTGGNRLTVVSGTNGLLTSDIGSSTRGERDIILKSLS